MQLQLIHYNIPNFEILFIFGIYKFLETVFKSFVVVQLYYLTSSSKVCLTVSETFI